MPEKLKRCVQDLKSQGKNDDSAWAICVDSTGEKPHKDTVKEEVANATGMIKPTTVSESHNPLDIPFGYEVAEGLTVPGGAGNIKIDNSHSGRQKLNEISDHVVKQLLETQLGSCPCKNNKRPKRVSK